MPDACAPTRCHIKYIIFALHGQAWLRIIISSSPYQGEVSSLGVDTFVVYNSHNIERKEA